MRRYEYQQRRSASKVHSRRHGSRPQSHSTPTATKTSVIRANACVQRTMHASGNRVCVFQYIPETRPVEPRYCGPIPQTNHQIFAKEHWEAQPPWYLNVRRLLHLNRVSVDNSVAYITSHCYRPAQGFHMYEFGRHLYANRDGYLCTIEMWQAFRSNDPLFYSYEQSINDVLPKIKCAVWRNKFVVFNTLSVSCDICPLIINWWNNRWWFKYGREERTRFLEWESIEQFESGGTIDEPTTDTFEMWKIAWSRPHFGVFVDNKAKLILRDTIKAGSVMDYNHTLIQSGVFIAIQGVCGVTFMDNTQKVYELKDVRRSVPTNPIIVVNAVPSIGESLCWGLTIGGYLIERRTEREMRTEGTRNVVVHTNIGMECVLNVPLLGMNNERMQIYDWERGFKYVSETQDTFNYFQFVRSDPNFAVSEHDVRSAQFVLNEPLEYPRI